jgi:ribosomal protein L39E
LGRKYIDRTFKIPRLKTARKERKKEIHQDRRRWRTENTTAM